MTELHAEWHPVVVPNTVTPVATKALSALAIQLAKQVARSDRVELAERLRVKVLREDLGNSPRDAAARVIASCLCDLSGQGWMIRTRAGRIQIRRPDAIEGDVSAEKERVRAGHIVERNRQLSEAPVQKFIRGMEESRIHDGRWVSIFSLMRDGRDLAGSLRAHDNESAGDQLRAAIDPYLQVADADGCCEFTGLRLMDIWRYFRFTWSTVHQSIPGRRMLLLVRDRAHWGHPVIGIAALGSSVVQLGVRDRWIGWTAEQMVVEMQSQPSRAKVQWLMESLEDGIASLFVADLITDGIVTRRQLATPTEPVVRRLEKEATRARSVHERYPQHGNHKLASTDLADVDWEQQARSHLFRSKRAATLATLLDAKRTLMEEGLISASKDALSRAFGTARVRRVVAVVQRTQKARHVGIDMLDITVCGAVPPYSYLLGGKLVALLMCSPEIVDMYRQRYGQAVSVIASSMKGALVRRAPRLVLLGTTSLYGIGSSQYNRLRLPLEEIGGEAGHELRYELLGKTEGFGSYHFSSTTMREIDILTSQRREGRRVNSIFGEGVNPKMRKVREALDLAGLPAEALLQHGSARLVYGVALASNFREVLLGRTVRPKYTFISQPSRLGTDAIAAFWRKRWLRNRIRRTDVLDHVEGETLARPITHGARVVRIDASGEMPLFEQPA